MKNKHQMISELIKTLNNSDEADVKNIYELAVDENADTKSEFVMTEEVTKLFENSEMTKELQEQTVAIFEVAVNEAVSVKVDAMETAISESVDKIIADINEANGVKIDKYLTYVVENWAEENKVGIDNKIKLSIAEDFIGGLKTLFVDHNINIDETETKVVDNLATQVCDLENKLSTIIDENIEMKSNIKQSEIKNILESETNNLADSEAERLGKLMEAFNELPIDDYKAKLTIVKDSYFTKKTTVADINENVEPDVEQLNENENTDKVSHMSAYLPYLSNKRQAK